MLISYNTDTLIKGYRHAAKGEYLVENALEAAKKAKQERKRIRKGNIRKGITTFLRDCQEIQALIFNDRYHIYHDFTFFAYDVALVRVNVLQNTTERYVLRLLTTHDAPHYYATLLTHHYPNQAPRSTTLAPKGSDWIMAFAAFTSYFQRITGVEWEERLLPKPSDPEAFVYMPPNAGEPRGLMRGDWPDL
ncbi:MAG: hypothetical protein Q9201_005720 [Fulgogasparrea decipioides]